MTSGAGLFALTYALIEANTYGWTSGRILAFVRPRRGPARRASSCWSCTSAADARPLALPERHVRGRQRRDPARRLRDVRHLLLRLALHAEHPRLLGRAGRRRVPADDAADHPRRADRGEALRPRRLALADDGRDDAARASSSSTSRRSARPPASEPAARRCSSAARDGADDDAERGGGDARRCRSTSPASARRC